MRIFNAGMIFRSLTKKGRALSDAPRMCLI